MQLAIDLGVVRLQFFTGSQTLLGWLSSYYTEPLQRPAGWPVNTPGFKIAIEELGSPGQLSIPGMPDGRPGSIAIAGSPCLYASGRFYSAAGGRLAHEIEVLPAEKLARINVGGDFVTCAETFLYSLVRDLLSKLVMPLFGSCILHGCVTTDGHNSLFLSGQHGMGKSTMGLRLLARGHRIVSDDSPLCFSNGQRTLLLPMLDELSVTEQTLQIVPELRSWLGSRRQVSGKYFLSRRQLGGTRLYHEPVEISHLVFLRRKGGSQTRLLPGNRAEAIFELLRESMLVYRYPGADNFDGQLLSAGETTLAMVSELVSRSRIDVLEYSDENGDEALDLIWNLLNPSHRVEELAPACPHESVV